MSTLSQPPWRVQLPRRAVQRPLPLQAPLAVAQLAVVIESVVYWVAPVGGSRGQWARRPRRAGEGYILSPASVDPLGCGPVAVGGSLAAPQCSCPAHQSGRGRCVHVVALVQCGLLPLGPSPSEAP